MSELVWTLRTLLSHWMRHPLQLAAMLVGLTAATALFSGVQAINQQAQRSYDRAAAAFDSGRAPMLVARDGRSIAQQSYIDLRRAGWKVSPMVEGRIEIRGRAVRLLGLEPLTLPRDGGATLDLADTDLGRFLLPPGQTLAAPETLAELGLKPGDRPALADAQTLPPIVAQAELLPGVLIVDIGVAQRALAMPDRISRMVVGKADGPSTALDQVVGDRLRLLPAESDGGLASLTASFHLNLTAFGLLSFFVGLFIVHAAIGLAFEQRLPTLRTVRACGVSARRLIGVLLAELVLVALVAGFIGLLGGILIAALMLPDVAASLRGLYGAQVPGELHVAPVWWIEGLAISVAGALVASLGSVLKLLNMPLIVSAQPRAWLDSQQRLLLRQGVVALGLVVAAAAALSFGDSLLAGFTVLAGVLTAAALSLPVLLAGLLYVGERRATGPLTTWFWADSRLQLSGLSLALMALLLALSVNIGVGTMVESFSQTFNRWLEGRLAAEIYLTANSRDEAVAIEDWLKGRREVTAILPSARAETPIAGGAVELLGLTDDPTYRAQWPLLTSTAATWDRVFRGDGALISEQLARRLKLGLGDPLPLGAGAPLTVAGIHADYGNAKGQIALANDVLVARFPDAAQTRFGLRLAPRDVPAVLGALRAKFDLDARHLSDQSAVKAEANKIFRRTFAVTGTLNAFTLGVAGISLFASLLTLGNSRLPQLAPLWAAGIPRRRLAALEFAKTMALALLTALLALPLGVLVAWCLVAVINVKAFGWRLPLQVFPAQMLQLLVIAMVAAGLAACLPILRLARMPPARLIRIFADER